MNLLDTKVNPNCLLLSQRESRRRPKSCQGGGEGGRGAGWLCGAMVLGKLSVPRRPTNMDNSRTRAYCACNKCGWGCLDIFL